MGEEHVLAAEDEPTEDEPTGAAAEELTAEAEPAEATEDETAEAESVDAGEIEPVTALARSRSPVAAWPFLAYLALWAGLAVSTALLLTDPSAAAVPVDDPVYPLLLITGLFLVACGPILSGVVWLFARRKRKSGDRGGLLTTALIRGAAAALLGVVTWWAALLLVDALRLGLV